MNIESSRVSNQSIARASVATGEVGTTKNIAQLDFGGPNAAHAWAINFLTISYKKAKVSPQGAPPKTDYAVKPIGRTLMDGAVLLSEVQGEVVHDNKPKAGEFTAKEFGPVTVAFQFIQAPEIPPGHTLTVEFELIFAGGTFGNGECTEGIASLGYTLRTIHAVKS